jgi:hypothetical protein
MAEEYQEDVIEEAPVEESQVEYDAPEADVAVAEPDENWGGVFGDVVDDGFASRVNELGFDVNDSTDAQNILLDSYQQAYEHNQQWQQYHENQQQQQQQQQQQYQQQMQQMQQQAQYGQHFQQLVQDPRFQNWATGLTEEQQAEPEHWWSPPELNQDDISQWREQHQNTQTGQWDWGWKYGTPSEVVQAADKYVNYHEDWAQNLARNPQEVLPQIIEQEFDKLFVDRYGQLLDEFSERQDGQRTQQKVADINQRNADWVYQSDGQGGQARDYNGQLVLTPEGQEVIGYVNNLRQSGMTNPEHLWSTATQMMAGRIATGVLQQQQQAQQYSDANQQRNMQHLQRGAGHIPNREGSVAPAENPNPYSQNPRSSVGEKLRQQALSDGLF